MFHSVEKGKSDRFPSSEERFCFARGKKRTERAAHVGNVRRRPRWIRSSVREPRVIAARGMQGRVRINKASVSTHLIYLIFRQTRVPPARPPHARGQPARAGIHRRVIYPSPAVSLPSRSLRAPASRRVSPLVVPYSHIYFDRRYSAREIS